MRATKYMSRTTRFQILVVLQLPTFDSNFATLHSKGTGIAVAGGVQEGTGQALGVHQVTVKT